MIAYTLQREAEGKRAAAEAEYQAKVKQAEADAEAARNRSAGETALQTVAITVARSKVEVEAAQVAVEKQRVDVEAQALANRERYGRAAIEFELSKQRIEAAKEMQIAVAQALGQFFARSSFTMYGDPASAQKMVDSYMRGMGLGRTLDGFLSGLDAKSEEVLGRVGAEAADIVRAVAERISERSDASKAARSSEPSAEIAHHN